MKIATLDFETFWDTGYSLSCMTPLEYVMDPRFELQTCGLKIDGAPLEFLVGEQIRRRLSDIDWSKTAALGHNMSGFDAIIMAYRLGIVPKLWLCTLAMARPIHQKTVGLGLGKLVAHYRIGVKNNAVLLQTKGRRLADFTDDELVRMEEYNANGDTLQCRALFDELRVHFTPAELWQIDALVRMRTEPEFVLNRPLLESTLARERGRKQESLAQLATLLGTDPSDTEAVRAQLASAPKFSTLLTKLGVEVPTKPSKTNPDKRIPALAKTDQEFLDLQEHENELVATAAQARLEVKSTLLETRIEAFLTADRLAGGRLPIPIKYCGADTSGRDSGEEYNPQNLPRINRKAPKPSDALRDSIEAPEGHVIAVADQSQIELRVNHTLWRVPSSMQAFAADPKADLYRPYAAQYYGVPVEEIGKDDPRRQFGKVSQLSLQYGSGAKTFRNMAWTQYRVEVPMVYARDGQEVRTISEREAVGLELDGYKLVRDDAVDGVRGWRAIYTEIVAGWDRCNEALRYIAEGREINIDPAGLVCTCPEGIRLKGSGRIIRYPDLRYLDERAVIAEFFDGVAPDDPAQVRSRTGWWYGRGRWRARIYGGKVDENVVQSLARDSVFDVALEFFKLTGFRPKLRVHDELVYIFPVTRADELLALLQKLLRTPPKWWPELVVWSEGSCARSYGEAK